MMEFWLVSLETVAVGLRTEMVRPGYLEVYTGTLLIPKMIWATVLLQVMYLLKST